MPSINQRMAGNVAVVTGAARGIGRSIAERFAAEGARVACLDVSSKRIQAATDEMQAAGLDVHPYVVDVSRRDEVHSAIQRIETDLGGPVGVLVNNAVWARYQPIEEVDEVTLEQMLAVGLKGMIWAMQAAAPQMKRRGSGSVINFSSAGTVLVIKDSAVYCAMKSAVIGLTRAAAVEYGPYGIRVNAIAPGMIATPASVELFDQETLAVRTKNVPLRRFGEPNEIASVVAFLASAESSYMNGALVMSDGGVTCQGT